MSAWTKKDIHVGSSSTQVTKEDKVRAYLSNLCATLFVLLELKEI